MVNGVFTDQHAATLFAQAGLQDTQTATTMDGLFLMVQGRLAARAR
jgi:hypothetical protein